MFFVGEIYNSSELGPAVSGSALLQQIYNKEGVAGFSRIRGAFAGAFEDEEKIVLVRDQFGSVPLYYYSRPLAGKNGQEHWEYATSVRQLLQCGVPRKLSRTGFLGYMDQGCLQNPYTLIEGVFCVPPASCVVINKKSHEHIGSVVPLSSVCYWRPAFDVKARSQQEAQEAVRERFSAAIQEQIGYGGDPAAFLSGGIDSSAIVAMWRKNYDGPIRTYCVTHEDARTDERAWAKLVAERNGTIHRELMLTDAMIREHLDEAVTSYDQPSFDGLNFWFATRLVKEAGERVVLSGEGGDELFMGYGQFRKPRMAYKYHAVLRYIPRFMGSMIDALAPSEKYRKLGMLMGFEDDPYFMSRRIFSDRRVGALLSPELKSIALSVGRIEQYGEKETQNDLLNHISWLELRNVVLNMYLRDGFQTSASNDVTLRTPLLDVRLAELLYTIPGAMKCDDMMPKPMLVRSVMGGIPDECIYRKKQGFGLPFDRYFKGDLKDRIDAFLYGGHSKLFDKAALMKLGRQYLAGKVYWSNIWLPFMVSDWCDRNEVEL